MLYKLKKSMKPYNMAIVSVFIAVLALAIVSLISMAGTAEINKELDGVGLNGMSISAYNAYNENITDTDLYNQLTQYDIVTQHTPVLYDYAEVVFSNAKEVSTMCWGISPMAKDIVNLDLLYGKMLSEFDITNNNNVCLIDENVALETYGRTNIVGKNVYITVGGITYPFEIIGIVKKTSNVLNSLSGNYIPNFIYIPYTVMGNMTYKPNIDQVLVNIEDIENPEDNILDYLVNNLKFNAPTTLKVSNLSQQRESINNIVDVAFLALFAVSCVAVVVCSISVATSVNTAVSIQQRDIGIKLSLGASRGNIMAEFVLYSITACLLGIVAGIIGGWSVLVVCNFVLNTSYVFDFKLLLAGISVTLFLTVIFSLYPSWQAAKLTPVKALNRE